MNAQTAKITPGRWEVSQYGAVVGGEYHEYTNGFAKSQVALATMSDAVTKASMRDANAELIAEAGTVANETGLTPRQLADQRAELLAVCKQIFKEAKNIESDGYMDDDARPVYEALRAAIARATGEQP